MQNSEATNQEETLQKALEVSGQVMFEFDPVEDNFNWSNGHGLENYLKVAGGDEMSNHQQFLSHLSKEDAESREQALAAARENDGAYCIEYILHGADGREHWFEERGSWLQFGEQSRLVGVLRTIDDQKEREMRLSLLASQDELTGSLNRQRTKELLEQHICDTNEDTDRGAYIMVGIDNLGVVNNDFGFEVADSVIIETAKRIKSVVGQEDYIGRVAGTKFGLILKETAKEDLRTVCNKIMGVVRENLFESHKGGLTVSVCAGVALIDDEVTTADIAMSRAEAALDAAKQIGPSSWTCFCENTETVSRRARYTEMSDIILTALNERRIELAYQPIVEDLFSPVTKYECLIRMMHKGGEVPAPNFIPVAERLGLVHLLDRRVLELAIQTLRNKPEIELNVNLSWETLKDPVWAEGYLSHLRANRDVAHRITVELTETQMVDALQASKEFVEAIKELGCSFALDDFGAGYTSFRNLQVLDIDILKIDGSFVTGVSSSRENQLFVRTLLDLARNFQMKTVAEWVDNDADAMLLKGLGVDYLQGFYIGKPGRQEGWSNAIIEPSRRAIASNG